MWKQSLDHSPGNNHTLGIRSLETAVCLLERRNNDLLTWIGDDSSNGWYDWTKIRLCQVLADIPTEISKQTQHSAQGCFLEDRQKIE